MNRRDCMAWIGVGCLASSLPVAIAACSTKSVSGEFEAVGAISDLDDSGLLLNERAAIGPVLVIRDPNNSDTFLAVNPVCPHARCLVSLPPDQTRLVCPCHGSEFEVNGAVVRGPAKEPLGSYEVKVEGDQILVANG